MRLSLLELRERKAQTERGRFARPAELRLDHQPERLRLDDRSLGPASAGKQKADKSAQVDHRRNQVARRTGAEQERRASRSLARRTSTSSPWASLPLERRPRLEARPRHPERLEQHALDRRGKRLSPHPFDDRADDGHARVRVLRPRSRLEDQGRAREALHDVEERRRCRVEVMADRRLAHQARAMRHQLTERDRDVERVPGRKFGQDARHRRIEVELPLLDELHDREVGEQLGDRADPVHRLGRRRDLLLAIGEAESACPDDPLIVDQSDRKRRQCLRLDFGRDPGLEPPRDLDVRVLAARTTGCRSAWADQRSSGQRAPRGSRSTIVDPTRAARRRFVPLSCPACEQRLPIRAVRPTGPRKLHVR